MFVRYNGATQIWEVAVDPNNTSTAFNHLPVANPTQPLDIANKQYVDSLVGGGGFVPYVGATANVNLGAFRLFANRVGVGTVSPTVPLHVGAGVYNPPYGLSSIMAAVAGGTAISIVNTSVPVELTLLAYTDKTYISNVTNHPMIFRTNDVDRVTIGANGFVSLGAAPANALLNIPTGGNIWTTTSWKRGIELATASIVKWVGGGTHWGIGQAGNDQLYIGFSNANDASGIFNTAININTVGTVMLYNGLFERGFGVAAGNWIGWTPAWKSSGGSDGIIGNGTLAARYTRVGNTIFYTIQLLIGSTTVVPSGNWYFILPFSASSIDLGGSVVIRNGTDGRLFIGNTIPGSYFFGIADAISMVTYTPSVNYQTYVHANNPQSWATNDAMWISGQYQAS